MNSPNPPPHSLVVKIAEEYCEEGARFAMYTEMPDIDWDKSCSDQMQKAKKLLALVKTWIATKRATEDDLRKIAQCIDLDK